MLKGGGSAEVELVKGNKIKLSLNDADRESGTVDSIFVDYKNLSKVVNLGDRVGGKFSINVVGTLTKRILYLYSVYQWFPNF